jgi:tRNA A-37 threonylcarbamoyl transferase component Bud32
MAVDFRTLDAHNAAVALLTPLNGHPGRSSVIYTDAREKYIMKVQYLLCTEEAAASGKGTVERFFSVQLFNPALKRIAKRLQQLFLTGKLKLGNSRLLRTYEERLLKDGVTHEFMEEIATMELAVRAGITPPLLEWYIVRTGPGLALGVYIQTRAQTTLEDVDSLGLFNLLAQKGARGFYTLVKKCAEAGISHLDLIPSNLVVYNGDLGVIDFGLSIRTSPYNTSTPVTRAYYMYLMLRFIAWQAGADEADVNSVFGHTLSRGTVFSDVILRQILPHLRHYRDEARQVFLTKWKAEQEGQAETYSRKCHVTKTQATIKQILAKSPYNGFLFKAEKHLTGARRLLNK